jgi:ABC-type nitrate/sulfonate/bicarbonate transport system permease component
MARTNRAIGFDLSSRRPSEYRRLQHIFTVVSLAWGILLIVIIAPEIVGATVGFGYMVLGAQQTFRTERVFAIFVIGIIGFVTNLEFRCFATGYFPGNRETGNLNL